MQRGGRGSSIVRNYWGMTVVNSNFHCFYVLDLIFSLPEGSQCLVMYMDTGSGAAQGLDNRAGLSWGTGALS